MTGANGVGNQSEIKYPDGTKAVYEYDLVHNQTKVTETDGSETTFAYDGMARVTEMRYPNGWAEYYTYDKMGRILNVDDTHPSEKPSKTQKHTYKYDANGNIIYEYMRGNGTGQAKNETLYTYDALNRLITAHDNYGNSTRTYTYDTLGNLTLETGNGSHNCDYIYNNLNQQTDRSSDNWKSHTASTYDKRGNQDKSTGSNVKKTSTVVKQFVADFSSEIYKPLMEHEVNGLDYRYVYSDKARLSVVVQGIDHGSASLLDSRNELHAYYHCDYLGTTDYLTSAVNSKIISWTSYSEWGEISHNAVLKCGQRELDLVKEYATHDFDAVLNMYYAKARFYDADNRRFTAVDPVLDPSRYDLREYVTDPMQLVQTLYVKDNAVNWIDPLGKELAIGTVGMIIVVSGGTGGIITVAQNQWHEWVYSSEGQAAIAHAQAIVIDGVAYVGDSISGAVDNIIDGLRSTGIKISHSISSFRENIISYFDNFICSDTAEKGSKSGDRKINRDGLTDEEADAIDEILKDTERGKKTKGRTEERTKQGDYDDVPKDFDKIPLSDKKSLGDRDGMKGKLSSGKYVTVRRHSSQGSPTLQIPEGASRQIEIRYKK